MRLRALSVFVCSAIVSIIFASQAFALATGGAVAEEAPATPTTATPTPALHLMPVTQRSRNVKYSGPVYAKTETGEVIPYVAPGKPSALTTTTGGSSVTAASLGKPELLVPGTRARYVGGIAAAPMSAPEVVQEIVWAGDQIIGLPYIFGGGHASFKASGYDCSGTVSFALHGGDLLSTPEDSSEFMHWGSHGIGRWVTIFSNPGHAYMTVAGLRLDTSAADDPSDQQGPRWRPLRQSNGGYTVRHPLGL
ncbi:MAG TPA: hypothetical protein VH025_03585 [Solirubrobacteraceae bacterium]|nr:hypothetical protein [Solirubrobacteraceae bacterium]